jgi:DNA-directed RNA polymerase I subunit RPA2
LSYSSRQDRITKTQFRNFDIDGLPYPGSIVHPDGLINPWDLSIKNNKHKKKKSNEISYVDQVTISSMGNKQKSCTKAWIRTRISRAPKVGDKFASRAGQKGVLSRLWDDIDLPFCEQTGLRPDMIINPNAFPSRMTIGMLVEMITSKTGLLEGEFVDASPFQTSNRKNQPYDTSSVILENHGFHWNGEETLISGSTGEEQHVDIFIGSVYYQRLRQMVNDKFQVRSTGAINQLTHQPIKGRKFGGGIRFGEMERDSILAHGAAYLLHDRLHLSSDHCTINCCRSCGSVLFLGHGQSTNSSLTHTTKADIHKNTNFDSKCLKKAICHLCNTSKMIDTLAIPYVFKYLAVELSAMNIKLRLEIR